MYVGNKVAKVLEERLIQIPEYFSKQMAESNDGVLPARLYLTRGDYDPDFLFVKCGDKKPAGPNRPVDVFSEQCGDKQEFYFEMPKSLFNYARLNEGVIFLGDLFNLGLWSPAEFKRFKDLPEDDDSRCFF